MGGGLVEEAERAATEFRRELNDALRRQDWPARQRLMEKGRLGAYLLLEFSRDDLSDTTPTWIDAAWGHGAGVSAGCQSFLQRFQPES